MLSASTAMLQPLERPRLALPWAKAVAMKAETMRRLLLPAWARALRMVRTRQRPPGGGHQLGDGGLDALVGVGDDELHPAQAAPSELAQKLGSEGLGLGAADVHAERLAVAVCVDLDGDDHGDRSPRA